MAAGLFEVADDGGRFVGGRGAGLVDGVEVEGVSDVGPVIEEFDIDFTRRLRALAAISSSVRLWRRA